jgi:AcrR family transcriptional regulator
VRVTGPVGSVAPPARLPADERRRQLVEIGWRLLQSRPIHEMALDEVAAEAGISRTLVFHYFPTKGDFYAAVVQSAGEHLLRPVLTPEGASAEERVRTLVEGFVRLVERNRSSYTALVRAAGGGDQRVVDLIGEIRDSLVPKWLAAAEWADDPDSGGSTEAPGRSALARLIVRGWLVGMEETVLAWDPRTVSREDLVDHLTRSLFAELELTRR